MNLLHNPLLLKVVGTLDNMMTQIIRNTKKVVYIFQLSMFLLFRLWDIKHILEIGNNMFFL